MYLYHSFHLPHFHVARVGPLLMHAALRRLAIALTLVFSPIYVYQVFLRAGYSRSYALAAAPFFFVIYFLIKAAVIPLALSWASSKSLRWLLMIAVVPLILYFLAMVLFQGRPLFVLGAAGLWGFGAACFWVGFHASFVHLGDGDHFGKEVGLAQVLDLSAGFSGPLLGGVITQVWGFPWLFVFSALVLLMALIPLFRVEGQDRVRPVISAEALANILTHRRVAMAYFGAASSSVLNVAIWPLFIFMLFGSHLKLGSITAVAVMTAGLLSLLTGFMSDGRWKLDLIRLGAVGESLAWLLRTLVRSVLAAVSVNSIFQVFERVLYIPLDVLSYQKAEEGGVGY
jgi:MFS family permease